MALMVDWLRFKYSDALMRVHHHPPCSLESYRDPHGLLRLLGKKEDRLSNRCAVILDGMGAEPMGAVTAGMAAGHRHAPHVSADMRTSRRRLCSSVFVSEGPWSNDGEGLMFGACIWC